MFRRQRHLSHPDFSTHLRNEIHLWNITPQVSSLDVVTGLSTVSVDAQSQLFAVGTIKGEIRVYDKIFKESILVVPNGSAVKILQFARPRAQFKLLCFDNSHILHMWILDAPGSPTLQASFSFDIPIFRISTCSSHAHALLATDSGIVSVIDIINLRLSSYQIPYALDDQSKSKSPVLDVAILPNKLNYALIGYSVGVVLYDMVSRTKAKIFVRNSHDTANPAVLMTLSVHPAGQHFSAGYKDGFISIWDLNDYKQVWTGTVDGKTYQVTEADSSRREPIFKMEWIYAQGHNSVSKFWLVVLGGITQSSPQMDGVTALTFDPAHFNVGSSNVACHSYFYPSTYPVQDFSILLDAKDTVSGRILLISGDGVREASINAFDFPPKDSSDMFISEEGRTVELDFAAELEESEEISRDLKSTLEELNAGLEDPDGSYHTALSLKHLPLPYPLCVGATSVLKAKMVSLDQAEYMCLMGQQISDTASIPIPFCLMITCHVDSSVRFYDLSIARNLNLYRHPYLFDHLTIHVLEIPEIALRPDFGTIRITDVIFARKSLECIIQLSTGELVVYGLGMRQRTQDVLDDELVDISDVRDLGEVFVSRFILKPQRGDPKIVCLSDIGFMAVAYQNGYLIIIDMRGPHIILREMPGGPSSMITSENIVQSLSWIIAGVGDDHIPRPRLLAVNSDGSLLIYSLTHKEGNWIVDIPNTIRHSHHCSLTASMMSLVLDSQTGEDCHAVPSNLVKLLEHGTVDLPPTSLHCYWIIANRREIRVHGNITGDKIFKVSLSSQEAIDFFSPVYAHNSVILGTISRDQVVIYSLPSLETIHLFKLTILLQPRNSLSWTSAGDILQTNLVDAGMRLTFAHLLSQSNSSRSGTVNFRLCKDTSSGDATTNQTQAASGAENTWGTAFTGWIKGLVQLTTVTGEDMDLILSDQKLDEKVSPTSRPEKKGQTTVVGSTASLTTWGQGVYQQISAAAVERGERLGELQEHFQQLEAGSKDLAAQAKRMAEKQAAKSWFRF